MIDVTKHFKEKPSVVLDETFSFLKYILKDTQSFVLAGGALRDLYHGEDPRDYDIFISKRDCLKESDIRKDKQFLVDELREYGFNLYDPVENYDKELHENQIPSSPSILNVDTFSNKDGTVIQLIEFFNNENDWWRFDLSCNMLYYPFFSGNFFAFSENYFDSFCEKNFTDYPNSRCPAKAKEKRIQKIINKGYTYYDYPPLSRKYNIEGTFMQAGKKNKNNRIYPEDVMEKEFDKFVSSSQQEKKYDSFFDRLRKKEQKEHLLKITGK